MLNQTALTKDIAADDPIDINRVDPKRSLDFVVNTRSCRLEGFSSPYRCGQRVVRAGGERKKAEMTFFVDVVSAEASVTAEANP